MIVFQCGDGIALTHHFEEHVVMIRRVFSRKEFRLRGAVSSSRVVVMSVVCANGEDCGFCFFVHYFGSGWGVTS